MSGGVRKLRAGVSAGVRRRSRRQTRSSASRPASARPDSLLAHGNGRSYGDTCLNSAGALIDMRAMDRILDFDAATGIIEAEAGTLLSDIIAYAAPLGFFPQVVPGTQFVTLGGAIANDVHGKNHHRRGTFGRHVEAFTLLRSDGSVHRCAPTRNARAVRGDDRRHGADRRDPVRLDPPDARGFARHRRAGDAVPRPRRVLRADRRGRREQ